MKFFVAMAILALVIAPIGFRRLAEQPDLIGYGLLAVSGILLLLGFISVVKEVHAIEGWSGVAGVLIGWIILGLAISGVRRALGWWLW